MTSFQIVHQLYLLAAALFGFGTIGPVLVTRDPVLQNRIAHGSAILACLISGLSGAIGIFASSPVIFYSPSSIPMFLFQFRLDPLSSFFVLMISISGLAGAIYALEAAREYEGRYSIALLGGLFNAFLLCMIGVVTADNGFLFLILWE